MIKKTVISQNFFDDTEEEVTLYFNLSRTEMIENLHLQQRFTDLQEQFGDIETRESLTPEEIKSLLDLLKEMMRISYGVRLEGTNRFVKSAATWEAFVGTPAYDEFLWNMFNEPSTMMEFMIGIFPKSMLSEQELEIAKLRQKFADHPSAAPEVEDHITVRNPSPEIQAAPVSPVIASMTEEQKAELRKQLG